jgi:rare lipoprotein A
MAWGSLKRIACCGGILALAACGSAPHNPGRASYSSVRTGPGRYVVGRPYEIKGIWYSPQENWSYDETGIASWYGEQFDGRYTSDGEIFRLNELTAAHKTLQLPCVVRVTNLDNGRSLELRVNDRGPFAQGRIIDVSRRAAQLLGFEGQGTARVRVQLERDDSMRVAALAGRRGGDNFAVASAPPPPSNPVEVAAYRAPPVSPAPPVQIRMAANQSMPMPALAPLPLQEPRLTGRVEMVPVAPTQIFVQAGAFADEQNALRLRDRLRGLGSPTRITGAQVNGISVYRVRVGPAPSVDAADDLLNRVISDGISQARIVVD